MTIRDERGGALMLAVGYLAVMTLAASGFLAMLHHRMGVVRLHERAQVTRHLAEAGVEAALDSIAKSHAVHGTELTELGAGRFHVTATPSAKPGTFTLVSTGELVYDSVVMERTELVVEIAVDPQGRITALTWNPERVP